MNANRFTILTVPIDECEQVFWFVFDKQSRRSLEMNTCREARDMCALLNTAPNGSGLFLLLETSKRAFVRAATSLGGVQ